LCIYPHYQVYKYAVAVSFIRGEDLSTKKNLFTLRKSLINNHIRLNLRTINAQMYLHHVSELLLIALLVTRSVVEAAIVLRS
jgi:hypothetical protein